MSMLFTHFDDRMHLCTHGGTLGRKLENGTRVCLRCGTVVRPTDTTETFAGPVDRKVDRRSPTRAVR